MITTAEAFVLGHTVPIIGIYFNAVELLAEAKKSATGSLEERVENLIASLGDRQQGVIANVRRVQGLLDEAGLDAGEPPRLPADFYAWSGRVRSQVENRFNPDQIELAAAFLIGFVTGDALQTLNLGVYLEFMLDAGLDPWLVAQAGRLAEDQDRISDRLEKLAEHPLLSADGVTAVDHFASAFDQAPVIGEDEDHAAAAQALQAAMRQCAQAVPALEASFAPDDFDGLEIVNPAPEAPPAPPPVQPEPKGWGQRLSGWFKKDG